MHVCAPTGPFSEPRIATPGRGWLGAAGGGPGDGRGTAGGRPGRRGWGPAGGAENTKSLHRFPCPTSILTLSDLKK